MKEKQTLEEQKTQIINAFKERERQIRGPEY